MKSTTAAFKFHEDQLKYTANLYGPYRVRQKITFNINLRKRYELRSEHILIPVIVEHMAQTIVSMFYRLNLIFLIFESNFFFKL